MLSGILMIVSVVSEPVSHRVGEMDFLNEAWKQNSHVQHLRIPSHDKAKIHSVNEY